MAEHDASTRSLSCRLESLESRNLLSLIGSKPTLNVIDGPGVRHHGNGIFITQPAVIQVFGTAQPGAPGTTVSVGIYAEDSEGNLVNGGAPLATTTPNSLGLYHTLVSLPSMIPKDVNFLVARETATATQVSAIANNGTTISGLNGTLALAPGTISGLNASISNPSNAITGLGGTITTPPTPISNIAGTITTPVFPISTTSGPGTAGPAVSTLLGGTGTLDAQISTLAGGAGSLGATTSTLTQTGNATSSALTGTFANGTGIIAPSTGTLTTDLAEVAVSDPVTVYIHQPHRSFLFNGADPSIQHAAAHAFPRAFLAHGHPHKR